MRKRETDYPERLRSPQSGQRTIVPSAVEFEAGIPAIESNHPRDVPKLGSSLVEDLAELTALRNTNSPKRALGPLQQRRKAPLLVQNLLIP